MHSTRFFLLLLSVVFALGLFLRVNNLSSFPVGFHIDESSLGYNGYSLLLTGKDENNNPFPLYIDMFGDNRPSGYHYLTMLPIKLFGLNEFATRLPGAVFGALTIPVIYLFVIALFQSRTIGLTTALLYTIAPWSITLARAGNEPTVALFFVLLGFTCLLFAIRKKSMVYHLAGIGALAASFFFYHTPRLFVPLAFAGLIGLAFRFRIRLSFVKEHLSLVFSFVVVSLVSVALVFFITGGTGRFSQVNIFGFPETQLVMQEQIREDGIQGESILITRIFHNKVVNFSLAFLKNYFEYFTGYFLFIEGGKPIWYEIPGVGLILLVALPFLFYGIFKLLLHKNPLAKFPLVWLLLAPVVGAITVDDVPNINRAIVLFPMIEIISAYGLVMFLKSLQKRLRFVATAIIALLFLGNFLYFHHQYFNHANVHRTWYRNNGFKEMVETANSRYEDVNHVIVTKDAGGMYPLILFYTKYDPVLYHMAGSPKDAEYTGFGKYFFAPQACPFTDRDDRFPTSGRILYVEKGECTKDMRGLEYETQVITREDGTKAFRLIDITYE